LVFPDGQVGGETVDCIFRVCMRSVRSSDEVRTIGPGSALSAQWSTSEPFTLSPFSIAA
jgi:hypothetical protein